NVTVSGTGTATVNYYTLSLTAGTGISSVSGAGTYISGTSVSISATASTGYTFSKWTVGSGNTPSSTTTASTTVTVSSKTALTASATAITYTVSYNTNGGSGTFANQTKTYGQTLTLHNTSPTRSGYTFLGWSTSSTATSATYQPNGSYTANSSATLYAVWRLELNEDFADTTTPGLTLTTPVSTTNGVDYQFGVSDGRFRSSTASNGYVCVNCSFSISATISFTTTHAGSLSFSYGVESTAFMYVDYTIKLTGGDINQTILNQSNGSSLSETTITPISLAAGVTYNIELTFAFPRWYSSTYGYIDNLKITY
ncbi:MAG: InlB B-repeat-containing protein, partial [Bacilli bacterium]|nr:InlB B-repeat-containing protein [Bacilli bacterium]